MSTEGKINNPVPSLEEVGSVRMSALEKVNLIAARFAENQESFTRRADLVSAYKKRSLDLTTIPAQLQKYYSLNFGSNLYSLATYGFEEGLFHYILRADTDLSQYPSDDPDWGKIRDCVHEAAELIRSVDSKAGLIIDSPKLFEEIENRYDRDLVEYQMPREFTRVVPEFGKHVKALVSDGKKPPFGVSVAVFGIIKGQQRIKQTRFVGMNPVEWGV